MRTESTEIAEPPAWARALVFLGLGKVDADYNGWVLRQTSDPDWIRRSQWSWTVVYLVLFGLGIWFVGGDMATLAGAAIGVGIVTLVAGNKLGERRVASLQAVHGLGEKRSRFARWSAVTYNLLTATMVVAVFGVLVVVRSAIEDRDTNVTVGGESCAVTAEAFELSAVVSTDSDDPIFVRVEFLLPEPFSVAVEVVSATRTPKLAVTSVTHGLPTESPPTCPPFDVRAVPLG